MIFFQGDFGRFETDFIKVFKIYFEGAIPRERAADVKGRWRDVDGADERDASRVETICQHREKQKVSILY